MPSNCRNRKSSAARAGGLVAFRADSLDNAQNALGQVAIALALNINDQHRLGMDLTGAMGGAYFNVAAPVPVANADNTGTASIGASFSATAASDLTTSDYRLSYAAGVYTSPACPTARAGPAAVRRPWRPPPPARGSI